MSAIRRKNKRKEEHATMLLVRMGKPTPERITFTHRKNRDVIEWIKTQLHIDMIECIRSLEGTYIWCDENGRYTCEPNRRAAVYAPLAKPGITTMIYGDFIVSGEVPTDYEVRSLSEGEIGAHLRVLTLSR